MNPQKIFQRYAAQQKVAVPTGYRKDNLDGITRYTPIAKHLDGIVVFSELSELLTDAVISAQVKYFEEMGRAFEWKVYDFDTPADLGNRLERSGFARGPTEAFMVYETETHCPRDFISDFRIERIMSRAGLRHIVAIQEGIWSESFPWLESSLAEVVDRSAIYCAYRGEEPIGTGWIDFHENSEFAELHGGAVLPALRGRGVYSALFDVRVEEAKRRGAKFLAVDARPMSRPILLKKGFSHICETIPFRKKS